MNTILGPALLTHTILVPESWIFQFTTNFRKDIPDRIICGYLCWIKLLLHQTFTSKIYDVRHHLQANVNDGKCTLNSDKKIRQPLWVIKCQRTVMRDYDCSKSNPPRCDSWWCWGCPISLVHCVMTKVCWAICCRSFVQCPRCVVQCPRCVA